MKKIRYIFFSIIALLVMSPTVNAASATFTVSSNSVYVGDNFTVTVNMVASAAWNIHVNATGPVSGCSINQADATVDAMDTNKPFTVTCTATAAGTITLSLSGDVTSANDGLPVYLSDTKTVTVSNKPSSGGTPSGGGNQSGGTPSGGTNPNLSSNNKLKKLSVEGFDLTKKSDTLYELTVSNSVDNITIKAEAEDSKAQVTNAGKHKLVVGENKIEVVVTAESGEKNTIVVKVIRKEDYKLEDLEEALKDGNTNIVISDKTKVSKEDLNKIKNSGETVYLSSYDENKKELYSWILDGSKINDTTEFDTKISFDSSYKNKIDELTNYADGVYVNFTHHGKLPNNTKIKMYVGNKYVDGSFVNVYYYNEENNKIEKVHEKIEVKNGYIEFDIEHCSEYFVSMTKIADESLPNNVKSPFNVFIVICIIELIVIIGLIAYAIFGKKKSSTPVVEYTSVTPAVQSEVPVTQPETSYQEVNQVNENIDNQNNINN